VFNKRIKIFIIFSSFLLLVCLARLAQMQLLAGSQVQNDIAELKRQRGLTRQLNTLRGKILDRKGRELAFDEPRFWLNIDYSLSQYWDERIQKCMLLLAAKNDDPQKAIDETRENIHNKIEDIKLIINKCVYFGLEPNEIDNKIRQINNRIWNLRAYLVWKNNYPNQEFEEAVPDPNDRLLLVYKNKYGDIAEMYKSYPLLELQTEDDIFAAQLEFLNIEGIEILPRAQRTYPYKTVAAQTIGWVGPATQPQDKELFAEDKLRSYLEEEVCGREDGVEYVCEAILRGRRGEKLIDIDKQIVSHTEISFGRDVVLTLDIELQKRIENYLINYNYDLDHDPNIAAVVLDVETGDILALVSLPVYDLNRARYDYDKLKNDPNRPLINRAINARYPPGSVVKPLILIAGLETNMITPETVIPCPAEAPPPGWPKCLIWRRNSRMGHSLMWENSARNAIKGSCNIYFSRLTDMIDPKILQYWLYKFSYGQNILSPPDILEQTEFRRTMRQLPGTISSTDPKDNNLTLEQMPPLRDGDRRYFGIGQGNLRATPLQVANAMATIARRGIFKYPRLFKEIQHTQEYSIDISEQTFDVVYGGMWAVVNETNGTANKQFGPVLHTFTEQDVKIYGKTGSTEGPEHAWFAGFAEDSTGRKLAFAVVVEGGQHGSSDAAPLACNILQICIEEGYIGKDLYSAQGL
jgi:penicillin-binding protein 2